MEPNAFMRQPDPAEMRAVLQVNVAVFSIFLAAVRITPLVS